MANVFGTVIDNSYVKKLPNYIHKDVITAKDRADVALAQQYSRGYNTDAANYVKKLKDEAKVDILTLIVLYNATGNPIEYAIDHDWYGKLGTAPYPQRLENGQWAGFLHQKTPYASSGSNGAVVYHGTDASNNSSDIVIAWDTPWGPWYSNKAYTEVSEKNNYNGWTYIYETMSNGGYNSDGIRNGLKSQVSTSSGDIHEYVATLSLS